LKSREGRRRGERGREGAEEGGKEGKRDERRKLTKVARYPVRATRGDWTHEIT